MVRVGFIGFGRFAQTRRDCFDELSDARVVGFYDPAFPAAVDQDGLTSFASAESLIESVDAIIISVPPRLAPQYVILGLVNRKHVFCEKPAAVNIQDLNQISSHLDPSLVLAYGFNHRQHASVARMRELIQKRELGDILWMRGRYGKEVQPDYRDNWRCDYDLNGGGILIDQGIHMIDLMSYLAGGFSGAQAVLSNRYLGIDKVEDNAFITLYSEENRIAASVHSTITQWRYLFSLEVFCERGSLVLNGLRTKSGSYGDEILAVKPNHLADAKQESTETRYESNTSWKAEIEAFVQAIVAGTTYPFATYSDAQETTALIDMIYSDAKWI